MSWYPHKTVAVVVEKQPDSPGEQARFLMVEELINGRCVFNQPAGHLEAGESLQQAAVRETLEETACHVELTGFIGLYQSTVAETGVCYIRTAFAARLLHHDAELPLDGDILCTHWLTLAELKMRAQQLRSPAVLQVIEDYLNGQVYPLSLIKTLN